MGVHPVGYSLRLSSNGSCLLLVGLFPCELRLVNVHQRKLFIFTWGLVVSNEVLWVGGDYCYCIELHDGMLKWKHIGKIFVSICRVFNVCGCYAAGFCSDSNNMCG